MQMRDCSRRMVTPPIWPRRKGGGCVLLLTLPLLPLLAPVVQAHPQCLDFTYPRASVTLNFCKHLNGMQDGTCCTVQEDAILEQQYTATVGIMMASAICQEYYTEIMCEECHPWASHLHETGTFLLKRQFCLDSYNACAASLGLSATYCDEHSKDPDPHYSYPFNPQETGSESTINTTTTATITTSSIIDSTAGGGGRSGVLQETFPRMHDGTLPGPILAAQILSDNSAWWLVSQFGLIYEVDNTATADYTTVILDLTHSTQTIVVGGERGLLGLALSPDFKSSGVFFVCYSGLNPAALTNDVNRVSQFTLIRGDPEGTAATERTVIEYLSPYANHNGGWLGFDPTDAENRIAMEMDTETGAPTAAALEGGGEGEGGGFYNLYISVGDGGSGNDPENHAQDLTSLLGKILRVRVSSKSDYAGGYTIPIDNPYYGDVTKSQEIWAYGMRNAWRCSFDRLNGTLWCADVGQMYIEEIVHISAGDNHGWPIWEGTRCNVQSQPVQLNGGNCNGIDPNRFKFAVYQYCHSTFREEYDPILTPVGACGDYSIVGNSITGGFVYRGTKYADVYNGTYFFSDYDSQTLGQLIFDSNTTTTNTNTNTHYSISTNSSWIGKRLFKKEDGIPVIATFAEDNDGELYIIAFSTVEMDQAGYMPGPRVYDLPCPATDGDCPTPSLVTLPPTAYPTPAPTLSRTLVPTPRPTASPAMLNEPVAPGESIPASQTILPTVSPSDVGIDDVNVADEGSAETGGVEDSTSSFVTTVAIVVPITAVVLALLCIGVRYMVLGSGLARGSGVSMASELPVSKTFY